MTDLEGEENEDSDVDILWFSTKKAEVGVLERLCILQPSVICYR